MRQFSTIFLSSVYKIIFTLFALVAAIVFVIAATYNSFVSMNAAEQPIISLNPVYMFIFFIIIIGILCRIQPLLKNINPNHLFLVLSIILTLAGLYLAIFADDFLRGANPSSLRRSDPGACVTIARHLNSHNYLDFQTSGYLHMYPYQIYWITLLRVLLKINNRVRFLYIVLLFSAILAYFVIFKISQLILKNSALVNTSLILYFIFLPNIFNILFVYANLPAFVLFLFGILCYLLGLKKKSLLIYVSAGLIVFSYLLKNNFLIGLIAFLITVCLSNIKVQTKLILLLMSVLMIFGCNFSINHYYSSISHVSIVNNKGMPKSAYLLMGLSENGNKDGWFDGSTVRSYMSEDYSTNKTDLKSRQRLKLRLHFLLSNPRYTKHFFSTKLVTTWGDPTYQSLWNAPLTSFKGSRLRTPIMRQIYSKKGNTLLSKAIRRISYFSVLSILFANLLTAASYLKKKMWKSNNLQQSYITLAFLFLIGGFTFHLLWETKSQYVWQYIVLLIPCASVGINSLYNKTSI